MKKRLLLVVIGILVLSVAGLATGVALAYSDSKDVGISLRVVGEPSPTPTPTPTGDLFTVSPSFLELGDVEPGDVITKYVAITKTGPGSAYTIRSTVSSVPWGSVAVNPSGFILTSSYSVKLTITISESATPGEYSDGSIVNFYIY